MASQATNEAVEAYRKVLIAEDVVEVKATALNALVVKLSREEWPDYLRLTRSIDAAVAQAAEVADDLCYAESTRRQRFRQAVHGAGRDS